ncbi:MAG: hypothetical protein ACLQU4_03705 [Limisphaerales bacterium]
MEEAPKPSKWNHLMRRGLVALAWIVSLIALCYGVIDWRGRHAWNEYRQNYEAHVAPLEFAAFIPKPIPDSENFAATPFVQSWFKQDTNFLFGHDTFSQVDKMLGDPPKRPDGWKYERHFENLVAWQEALAALRSHAKKPTRGFWSDKLDLASRAQAAPDVLDALKDDEAVLQELRMADSQPGARYPIVYDVETPWVTLLPHLAKIKMTCFRLKTKACAELAAGQNENALDDLKLVISLADSVKTEPFLISYLVRLACMHIAIQPIWEGLAEHRWTDTQLQQLQTRLAPYDFLADMQFPLRTERVCGVWTVDMLKKKGVQLLTDVGEDNSSKYQEPDKLILYLLGQVSPSGWYDEEKLHYCLRYDDEFRGIEDDTARRVFPSKVAANVMQLKSRTKGVWNPIIHHEVVAKMFLPALSRVPIKAAAAQAATDQAAVACALEQYRLANGQFPGNLQALVPRFIARLPNDVITGESFKYRRTDDGRFVLYSVGWNEKDDGGVPGKTMFDETEGDWVWEYPVEK